MNWASSLDDLWRTPNFPMWLTLAAAGFFGVIMVATLIRAEKSVANGALTVITLLAITVAVAATIRGFESGGQSSPQSLQRTATAPPALSCMDDLAGEAVLNACEKTLFASPESVAAAVSYAAFQIGRLNSFGDLMTAERNASPEVQALRRAVEHDRYGLIAYVLMSRDRCTQASCPVFASLSTNRQIASNMDQRVYENLITRYASAWGAYPSGGPTVVGALPTSIPTGKPTNAEFPSASSTPPVSIMAPEPGASAPKPSPAARPTPAPAAAAASPTPDPSPTPTAHATTAPPAAPKKQAAAPKQRTPVQIAPSTPSPAPGAAPPPGQPAAAND
jgi:hypothetical protein